MARFKKFVVMALAAIEMVLVVVAAARAEDLKAPKAAGGKTQRVYAVERTLPGARVESALTSPRSLVIGRKRGTGWLLHYSTKRDNCARPDATSGLRVMCLGW